MIWQCLEIFLDVTVGEEVHGWHLVGKGQRCCPQGYVSPQPRPRSNMAERAGSATLGKLICRGMRAGPHVAWPTRGSIHMGEVKRDSGSQGRPAKGSL